MPNLKRLSDGFQIGEEYMKGAANLPHEIRDNFVEDIRRDVPLKSLDDAVENVISSTKPTTSEIDQLTAPRVHQTLRLTRREAGDMGIWRYLTVVRYPEFVRHRWGVSSPSEMRRRFIGSSRWNSNALSRLWWAAELTYCEQRGYELTKKAFVSQHVARSVFERNFGKYHEAAAAFIEVFHKEQKDVVEAAVKRFNQRLGTIRVEGLEQSDLESILQTIKQDVKSGE